MKKVLYIGFCLLLFFSIIFFVNGEGSTSLVSGSDALKPVSNNGTSTTSDSSTTSESNFDKSSAVFNNKPPSGTEDTSGTEDLGKSDVFYEDNYSVKDNSNDSEGKTVSGTTSDYNTSIVIGSTSSVSDDPDVGYSYKSNSSTSESDDSSTTSLSFKYNESSYLIYDIEKFDYSESNGNSIDITGWAYIKYENQCGDLTRKNDPDYLCWYGGWETRNDVYYGYYSSSYYLSKIKIYLGDKDGNVYINATNNAVTMGPHDSIVDLHSWNCWKSEFTCYGYRYSNTGFKARINLEQLNSDKTYYLWIAVGLYEAGKEPTGYDFTIGGKSRLGVYDVNATSEKYEFTNGAAVTVENLSTHAYFIASDAMAMTVNNSGYFTYSVQDNYYRRIFSNGSEYRIYDSACGGSSGCGFSGDYPKIHKYKIKMYKLGTKCPYSNTHTLYPGSSCRYWSNAAWLQPSSSSAISIKYDGGKYCNSALLDDSNVIDDCNGSYNYSCTDEMSISFKTKVDDKEVYKSVNVIPSESATLSLGDDYNNLKVYSGAGFNFDIKYKDVVSFKITKNDYGFTESKLKTIYNYLTNEYYLGNDFETRINELKIRDNYLSSKKPDTYISGKWVCKKSDNEDDFIKNIDDTLTITYECDFKLGSTYYDYNSNGVFHTEYDADISDYKKDGSSKYVFIDSDKKFYTSIDYCSSTDSSKGKYRWDVIYTGTSTGNNLSNLQVQVDRKNKKKVNIQINTSINDNTSCYINVRNSFYGCDVSSGGGGSKSKYAFNYRSIDVSNPFPNITDVSKYPYNWAKYYSKYKNFTRINNSYSSKLEYKTVTLNGTKVDNISSLSDNYASWIDMTIDGRSSFVKSNYFDVLVGKPCRLGEFSDTCD